MSCDEDPTESAYLPEVTVHFFVATAQFDTSWSVKVYDTVVAAANAPSAGALLVHTFWKYRNTLAGTVGSEEAVG